MSQDQSSTTILSAGEQIGRFRILSLLGQGGMGTVYLAEDLQLRRQIALKILITDDENDALRRERFVREARLAAALHHPAIATIYEVGEDKQHPYLAIELIQGQTLRDLLQPGPIKVSEALHIAVQIAQGMAHAQSHKVLHRDLKPENIMISPGNEVKILDFGLAKSLQKIAGHGAFNTDQATLEQSLSREGFIVGTPGYMSPEQVRGLELDQRSDIFTFGIILHEMLTGESCFGGNTPMDILIAISRDPPRLARDLNPDVPQNLQNLLSHCLEKDLDKRCADFALIADKLTDIQALLPGDSSEKDLHQRPTLLNSPRLDVKPVGNRDLKTQIVQRGRRRQKVMSVAALALLLLIALALLWSQQEHFGLDPSASANQRGAPLRIATLGLSAPLSVYPRYMNGVHLFAAENVSEILMQTRPSGLEPAAVERWKSSPDRRSVDLYLRPDLHFHDHPCFTDHKGRKADLQDLLYSLELPAKMSYSLPPILGAKAFARGETEHLAGVQIHDNFVRVDFGRPCAFCLYLISGTVLVPRELKLYLESHKLKRLVGTGPFQMKSAEVAGHIDLIAFDSWTPPNDGHEIDKSILLPRSQGLKLMRIADQNLALQSLLMNQLDAYYLDSSSDNVILQQDAQGHLRLKKKYQQAGLRLASSVVSQWLSLSFLSLPPKKDSPLEDPALRHIIALALDRKALNQNQSMLASGSMLEAQQLGYLGVKAEQRGNISEAKKLFTNYVANHHIPRQLIIGGKQKLSALVAKQLQNVGFDVAISRAAINSKQAKDLDLLVNSWSGPLVGQDPSMMLYHMLGQARPTYLDKAQRQHFQDMMYELDQDKRRELIENMQKSLLAEERMLFLAHPKAQSTLDLWIFRKELQGFDDLLGDKPMLPDNFSRLYRRTLSQEQTVE